MGTFTDVFTFFVLSGIQEDIYIAIEINRRCKGNIGLTEKRFSL